MAGYAYRQRARCAIRHCHKTHDKHSSEDQSVCHRQQRVSYRNRVIIFQGDLLTVIVNMTEEEAAANNPVQDCHRCHDRHDVVVQEL